MLLVDNLRSRWHDVAIRWREARGELYPVVRQKRDQWAPGPQPKRDTVTRLLRFQSRLAAERQSYGR